MPTKYYTRKRLEEARYFYNHLSFAKNDDEFYFNLSAFLNAWRSILEFMLYDFNDFFVLGFSREDEIYPKEFAAVAKALKNTQAIEFIEWLNKKQGTLSNNPLWTKRNMAAHRGYPHISEYRLFVGGTGGISGVSGTFSYMKPILYPHSELPDSAVYRTPSPLPSTVGQVSDSTIDPHNYYFTELEDKTAIKYCSEALKIIEDMIIEVEKKFSVQL